MFDAAYFVRHGDYSWQELNDAGHEQAMAARDTLVQAGVGRSALLLSSDITRAVQTAEILHESIGERVIVSHQIALASFMPEKIDDLEGMLAEIVKSEGYKIKEPRDVVVVAHSPLVAAVKGPNVSEDDIGFGEIVKYTKGSWQYVQHSSRDDKSVGLIRSLFRRYLI